MDSELKSTISTAYPETMDFLSRAWCNFAVQAFQDNDSKHPILKMDKSTRKMEDTLNDSLPWSSDDVKMTLIQVPNMKNVSIKKWLKEIKQRRKESQRLQRAEVHAALSVAGLAAALAAIAAENSKLNGSKTTKESAVASATALISAQCTHFAEAMGAKKGQLCNVLGSATSGLSATDIFTLTAAATASLRGAAMLKIRAGYKNRVNWSTPVLTIEDRGDFHSNFEKCRSALAKGSQLTVETPNGNRIIRLVSIVQSREGKVVLRIKKPNLFNAFSRPKESIVLDLHVELYKEPDDRKNESRYLILLMTNSGTIKLYMMTNYLRYKTWSMAIKHMLMQEK